MPFSGVRRRPGGRGRLGGRRCGDGGRAQRGSAGLEALDACATSPRFCRLGGSSEMGPCGGSATRSTGARGCRRGRLFGAEQQGGVRHGGRGLPWLLGRVAGQDFESFLVHPLARQRFFLLFPFCGFAHDKAPGLNVQMLDKTSATRGRTLNRRATPEEGRQVLFMLWW